MGDLRYLAVQAQAKQLGMRSLNLRRAMHGQRAGERTIAEILTGTALIARRRGAEPPAFEDLFEIRGEATPVQGPQTCDEDLVEVRAAVDNAPPEEQS